MAMPVIAARNLVLRAHRGGRAKVNGNQDKKMNLPAGSQTKKVTAAASQKSHSKVKETANRAPTNPIPATIGNGPHSVAETVTQAVAARTMKAVSNGYSTAAIAINVVATAVVVPADQ